MTDDKPRPEPTPLAGGRDEEVRRLVKTIQQEAEEMQFVLLEPGPPPRSRLWYVVLVLAVLANGYVWIGQPDWLLGESAAQPTLEERERVLRVEMYLQGQRIEAYRAEHGELPERLEDAGPPLPGMRYQRSGSRSWELLGESGDLRLILLSSQPMGEFLGPYERLLGLERS